MGTGFQLSIIIKMTINNLNNHIFKKHMAKLLDSFKKAMSANSMNEN